ncbi:hypothetical protein [Agarilytica rhodophyticola]|uniref:hypothetical protein n=1 Tax=Agarilytica rhodophyticola TaxID=1737490 RepID=UPI001315A494|nr:hypothetical protein [Agarilytica rhodophyticola]
MATNKIPQTRNNIISSGDSEAKRRAARREEYSAFLDTLDEVSMREFQREVKAIYASFK